MIPLARRALTALLSRPLPAWPLLVVLLATAGAVAAQEPTIEDGGRFEVRSAYLEPVEGVLRLTAVLDLALARSAAQALRNGVPVTLQAELVLNRKRHYFADQGVAHLVQRWQLRYHALSEHYLVTNLNSGQQTSYPSLGSALSALSDVRGLPILDEALIDPKQRYEASMRLSATIEGGLPEALRVLMFWADWNRTSDWYTWTLRT
jgi:Domain of unknown function (DUF4390)